MVLTAANCLAALLSVLLLADPRVLCFAAPSASPSEPSGAAFFHQGDEPLSWDSDELSRVRKLHDKNFSDKKAFLAAPDMATYLGLSLVDSLHMPVPLSIIFVGFQGDGNLQVNISTSQLQEWFGHLDHILPHTRVELAELTCAEDGHCAGLVHGVTQPTPVPSFVHLNFSCNVVVIKRQAAVTAFEHAIQVFSRPVDPELEMGAQQVDAAKMEAFVDNFVDSLGLGQGYSLVVLNTPWSVTQPVYGYRLGMSQAEMDVLAEHKDKVATMLGSKYEVEPSLPFPYGGHSWYGGNAAGPNKFSIKDATWNSEFWVQSVDHYLRAEEAYRKAMMQQVGTLKGAAAVVQAVRLMRRLDTAMAGVLKSELLGSPGVDGPLFSKFRTMHPAEDCQVGNWVGHRRWALLDLTAGGFDWGPAMGGDGVVHRRTVPSVMDHFSHVQTLKQKARDAAKTPEEQKAMQRLAAEKAARVAQQGGLAFQVFSREMAARARSAGAPGAAPLHPAAGSLGDPEEEARWQRRYLEISTRAELDVLEQTARRHCGEDAGEARLTRVCVELQHQVEAARVTLSKLASSQAIAGDIWRDHRWDIFGPGAHAENWEADFEVSDETIRTHDVFLAELASLMSRALRHVVAPPTATWTHASGYMHNTATPWSPQVKFELYIIQDSTRDARGMQRNPQDVFDVERYKQQVLTLQLPNQRFEFMMYHLSLSDDAVLATAFASALRVSSQQIPADHGALQETERVYVDSRALSHVLRQRFELATDVEAAPLDSDGRPISGAWRRRQRLSKSKRAARVKQTVDGHSMHVVPVFIFEVQRDLAILIDEHYNAKALEDMIVVVQNWAREDEHPTGMMCNGAVLARPLSPLREALSATLTHLGGVLPPHLGYNPGKRRVTHDWLWSVGAHPHSFTSVGTQFTDLQRDSLARSYLLDTLDSSVDAVNAGISQLLSTRTTPLTYQHMMAHRAELNELLASWQALVERWRTVMNAAWTLDWTLASSTFAGIESDALQFKHLAEVLSTIPAGGNCQGLVKPTTEHLVFPALVVSAIVAGSALLYLATPLIMGVSGGRRHGVRMN